MNLPLWKYPLTKLHPFSGAADVLYCAAATKDGMIYAGCHDGYVYSWTVATGKLEGKLPAEPTAASQAAKGP